MLQKKLLILFGILCLGSCSSAVDFRDMSVEQLAGGGFYGYILLTNVITDLSWDQMITMKSFDAHCTRTDTIQQSNPVQVIYQNDSNRTPFAVEISPSYQAWDRSRDIQTIELNLDWVANGQAEYYTTESGGIVVKFKDKMDMDVVVFSWTDLLSIEQITRLILQLRYIGPEPQPLHNPWDTVCKT